MATDLNQTPEPQPAAAYCQPECDWTTMSHQLCGAPISIPTCAVCGRVNGDAIRRQVDDIVAERTAELRGEAERLRDEHLAVMGATADLYASVYHYLVWTPKPPSSADRVLLEKVRDRLLTIGFGKEGVDAEADGSIDAVIEIAYAERLRAALAGAEQATTDARRVVEAAKAWRRWKNFEYRAGEINPHLLTAHQEDLDLARAVDALAADVPAAADDHEHPGGYLSTACLHELHEPECGAAQRARGDHSHPHCKYCGAKCVCPCHTGGQVARAERVHADGCTLAADDPHHSSWCALPSDLVSGVDAATVPAHSAFTVDATGAESVALSRAAVPDKAEPQVSDVPAAGEAEA